MLDAAYALGAGWQEAGYQYVVPDKGAFAVGVSSFVDNLYTCSHQADTAVHTSENIETYLKDNWQLEFGSDSRIVMQTEGAPDEFREREGWQQVKCMKTLGQHVSNDGSIVVCVNKSIQQMWAAFHANMCDGLLKCSDKAKCIFLQGSLMSICTWRWARWPYCKKVAARLNGTQGAFIIVAISTEGRRNC